VKTSVGSVVDVRGSVIVMTSNLGSRELSDMVRKRGGGFGFSARSETGCVLGPDTVREVAVDAVRKWMKPEMFSRISAIVPFVDLTEEEMCEVARREWDRITEEIPQLSKVDVDDPVFLEIARRAGEKSAGARAVRHLIDTMLVDRIAAFEIENQVLSSEGILLASYDPEAGHIVFSCEDVA
jgi:ATP-dependent Clp protease ATP-binding subunit ClpA